MKRVRKTERWAEPCSVEGNKLDSGLLEQWIILQGKEINSRREVKELAADSLRFNSKIVKLPCGAY